MEDVRRSDLQGRFERPSSHLEHIGLAVSARNRSMHLTSVPAEFDLGGTSYCEVLAEPAAFRPSAQRREVWRDRTDVQSPLPGFEKWEGPLCVRCA